MGSCRLTLLYIVFYAFIAFCWSTSTQRQDAKTDPPGVMQTLRGILSDLSMDARSYLVSLIGERPVNTSLQCIRGAVHALSEGAASCLNIVSKYTIELLSATGIKVHLPYSKVTPEGVIFVTQWALLAVIGYWILSLLLRLVAGVVRRVLWLLKLTGALVVFGLILNDTEASMETTAARLAGLVAACVLLGVGPHSRGRDQNAQLEEQVMRLEKRLREMERRRKQE